MNRRTATNVAKPIFIGPLFENGVLTGRFFASVAVAAANLGMTEKTLRKYINEKPEWNYFSSLTSDEQQEIKEYLGDSCQIGSFSHGREVKVGDITFPSVVAAARYYELDNKSVRKRIDSSNFEEWSWGEVQ
uniref:Putative site-specific DNA endonuclease n=1 Tax=Stigeoclonium helveticum TaxID=55999 RepID=Q06SD9_STIHE|nr:putative site-specific DNA endonuclease [Stigeoclonium helveticum]ABF60220.1 putative site-specific DNA endonuclease [Stigeoclonium helveticum]